MGNDLLTSIHKVKLVRGGPAPLPLNEVIPGKTNMLLLSDDVMYGAELCIIV